VPAWALGAQYLVTPSIELGVQYSSAIHVDAKGTGTSRVGSDAIEGETVTVVPLDGLGTNFCALGGTPEALKACVNLSLPQMVIVGGRYIIRDADDRQVADVELDVQWENWGGKVTKDGAERAIGDYQVIVDGFASIAPGVGLQLNPSLIRHNLQDTFSVRLGGSYQLPLAGNTLVVRGGVAYDTVAAKDGWQRVDFDGAARLTTTAGASLVMSRIRIDVGLGKVFEGTREQGTGCNPTVPDPGCGPGGDALPVEDRVGPDPVQPTADSNGQVESPFTGGTISSGYNLLMLGVTTWF
jgi:long-subunit fatty acid transport protein